MKSRHTYFGINFNTDFPIEHENRRKLAKILFQNPKTGPTEALCIINNIEMFSSGEAVLENLIKEASILKKNMNEQEFKSSFLIKLSKWVIIFEFPMPEELNEILLELAIPAETILESLLKLFKTLPSSKIIDFLQKYGHFLSYEQIDLILDAFINSIIEEKAQTKKQFELNFNCKPKD